MSTCAGTFFCLQAVAAPDDQPDSGRDAGRRPGRYFRRPSRIRLRSRRRQTVALAASYGKIVNFSSVSGRRGRPLSDPLCRHKGCHHQPHPVGGAGPGALPHQRQRRLSRHRAYAHVGEDRLRTGRSSSAPRPGEAMSAFIQQVPLEAGRYARGSGGRRGLFLFGGCRLHHRPVVERRRRLRDGLRSDRCLPMAITAGFCTSI